MGTYDPDERITAKQALRHPYFRDFRFLFCVSVIQIRKIELSTCNIVLSTTFTSIMQVKEKKKFYCLYLVIEYFKYLIKFLDLF